MSNAKKIAAGVVLTLAPLILVNQAKQTAWGKFQSTPAARMSGDAGAKVYLVEYSDFQCPMCARVQPTLHQFLDTYKGKVRLAYKYFPLGKIHRNAYPAARTAQCAAEQEKFWPVQDQLFAKQAEWAPLADPTTNYMAIAQGAGLDMTRFTSCYADSSKDAAIEQDRLEGEARQVNSTPTLFIGDERLVGSFIETDGARMIERELRRK